MNAVPISQIGEFGLIQRIKEKLSAARTVIQGIGDDTAVVPWTKDQDLLLTTDMLVEGVHFTSKTPARGIGHKALACNLSDIAAMGGRPLYALVSLGIPPRTPVRFVTELYRGMECLAEKFHAAIVGGDTVESPRVVVNVALTGLVRKKNLVLRRGARPGDVIFVTGPLGRSWESRHHINFLPRLDVSGYLVRKCKPTAMIDISDGLAADLGHILEASGVGARLYAHKIPLRKGARLKDALNDGEDFELLFTLPPAKAQKLMRDRRRKFSVYLIGEITAQPQSIILVNQKNRERSIPASGYTHF